MAHAKPTTRALARLLPAVGALLLARCAPLDPIPADVCGNGVVEPGEDCDRFAPERYPELVCAAPGDEGACHFLCGARGGGAGCPGGWSCGHDGRCRYAVGAFVEPTQSPLSIHPAAVRVADLDGDGMNDLLAARAGALEVRAGVRGGGYAEPRVLALPGAGPPALGDLDGDGRPDLVVPVPLGLVVVPGRRDGALLPIVSEAGVVQASALEALEVRALPVRTARSTPGQELVFLASAAGGPVSGLGGEAVAPLFAGPQRVSELGAHLPVVDLDGDGVDEVVLGFAGDDEVHVFTTVCSAEARTCAPGLVPFAPADASGIALGAALREDGVRVSDVDGDGLGDLLVGLATGELRVLLQGPSRTFGAPEVVPWLEPPHFGPAPLPAAAGDLDGDHRDDYFIDGCAWLVRPGPSFTGPGSLRAPRAAPPGDGAGAVLARLEPAFCLGSAASEVVIADLNRDGLPDLAALLPDAVEVRLGTGTARFNPTRYPLDFVPDLLRAGDFDGDLVPDLAVSSRQAGGLELLFGRLDGPPAEPVPVGELGAPVALEAGALLGDDLVSDLAVITSSTSGGETRFALSVLAGVGAERMIAPLLLRPAGAETILTPTQVAVGQFADDDGRPDVAVFVRPLSEQPSGGAGEPAAGAGLWIIPGRGSTRLDLGAARFVPSVELDDPVCRSALSGGHPQAIVGPRFGGRDVWAVAVPYEGLALFSFTGEGAALSVRCRSLALPARPVSSVVAARVGLLSSVALVVGFRDGLAAPSTAREGPAAWIYVAALATELDFPDPPVVVPRASGAPLLGVAALELDDRSGVELVEYSADALWRVSLPIDDADPPRVLLAFPEPHDGALEAADVDRDGLDDLLYSDGAQLHVLLAVPGSGPAELKP